MQNKIAKAKALITNADKILIGGAAGLSSAAGILYGGDRFKQNFPDFINKYQLTDMYSSGFYPFKTAEEKWAYWSRHIKLNRFDVGKTILYQQLLNLVKNKDYFVITTNADHQFFINDFEAKRIFEVQGDYGKWQCATPCHNNLYDNKTAVLQMVAEQKDCKIPTELIPQCPVCGGEMEMNLRKDNTFVQDENWYKSAERYENFVAELGNKNVVLMEMGVGYNTPSIIKYPFESIAYQHKNATLLRFNKDDKRISTEIKDKTILFDEDIKKVINLIN